MDSQAPSIIPGGPSNNAGLTTATTPMVELARHDTASSTGSATRLSEGHWALNLSGNCSSCHHHHKSVQVRVRVSGDSTEVGDVRCDKCKKLWIAFGKGNARRLSLLSTKSIDSESLEAETEFHGALIRIIKAANSIATLSPTLTAIPEAASAGPSRETSVRSTTRSYIRQRSRAVGSDSRPVFADSSSKTGAPGFSRLTSQKHTKTGQLQASKGWHTFLRLRHKFVAKFRTSRSIPHEPWIQSEDSPDESHHSQIQLPLPTVVAPSIAPLSSPEDRTEYRVESDDEPNQDALDVCTSSTTAAGALASLEALDVHAIENLHPDRRFEWGRSQLAEFRARYAGPTVPAAIPVMVNNGTQWSSSEHLLLLNRPLVRRHSTLAYVGNTFGTNEYWDAFRGSTLNLNGRPLSMSETNFSDADTAVERTSIAPMPHQLFIESLQRERRGSGSSRPLSMHSIVNDWQQVHRNRAEARLSTDSAATGNAVRNITTTRGRANNRLSRSSMNRVPSVYGIEPQTSRVQLRVDEETENPEAPGRVGSSPSSPPMSGTDISPQG
jgi:hypothetical protein